MQEQWYRVLSVFLWDHADCRENITTDQMMISLYIPRSLCT